MTESQKYAEYQREYLRKCVDDGVARAWAEAGYMPMSEYLALKMDAIKCACGAVINDAELH